MAEPRENPLDSVLFKRMLSLINYSNGDMYSYSNSANSYKANKKILEVLKIF